MEKVLRPAFWFGDIVFLKTDQEQKKRIVTDIEFRANELTAVYHVNSDGIQTAHYEFELTTERNEMMAMGVFKDKDDK